MKNQKQKETKRESVSRYSAIEQRVLLEYLGLFFMIPGFTTFMLTEPNLSRIHGFLTNIFFEKQKLSSLVFDQHSENDERYRSIGFNSNAMKKLVIDKDFVEAKITRIGNLLIFSSRLLTQLEKQRLNSTYEELVSTIKVKNPNNAFLIISACLTNSILKSYPPTSHLNLAISQMFFMFMLEKFQTPRNQILPLSIGFARYTQNLFRKSQHRDSNTQNPLAVLPPQLKFS